MKITNWSQLVRMADIGTQTANYDSLCDKQSASEGKIYLFWLDEIWLLFFFFFLLKDAQNSIICLERKLFGYDQISE